MLRCCPRVLLAPVYLQIVDKSKAPEIQMQVRKGVGFTVPFELGDGRDSMGIVELQRRVDDYMKLRSEVYGTVVGGKVMSSWGDEVSEVVAHGKYIITGTMGGGYVREDMKFGSRLNGYNGGKLRGGLKWAGSE